MLEPEVGNFYWIRQKYEKIWRVCYFLEDSDGKMWMDVLGVRDPVDVDFLNLRFFDLVKIQLPSDKLVNDMQVISDQPDPEHNNEWPVWGMVIHDMRKRDMAGRKKYGIGLQPFNGRNSLVDAYQEVLDLAVYLRQFIFEETGE